MSTYIQRWLLIFENINLHIFSKPAFQTIPTIRDQLKFQRNHMHISIKCPSHWSHKSDSDSEALCYWHKPTFFEDLVNKRTTLLQIYPWILPHPSLLLHYYYLQPQKTMPQDSNQHSRWRHYLYFTLTLEWKRLNRWENWHLKNTLIIYSSTNVTIYMKIQAC